MSQQQQHQEILLIAKDVFARWDLRMPAVEVLQLWQEPHRGFHTLDHLWDILEQIAELDNTTPKKHRDMLVLAAIFHDAIYQPGRHDNELRSADLFLEAAPPPPHSNAVKDIVLMILETRDHCPSFPLSATFSAMDTDILHRPYTDLLKWEAGIAYEYIPVLGAEEYRHRRLDFLEAACREHRDNEDALRKLIAYVAKN
jgi:predicted metal-dependent HD superfamily phosphohydrolase